MTTRLTPCPPPPPSELDALTPQRPIKIDGNYVHRYVDGRGHVRYERVTHESSHPRWYRVEG